MEHKELLSYIEKTLSEFNKYFMENPKLFLDELEIRNSLFRFLLKNLVHSKKFQGIQIGREVLVSNKPRVKYDLVIKEGNIKDEHSKLLFAFEVKYSYSSITKLLTVLNKDVERLEKFSKEHLIKGYLLFYNNFENYPTDVLNKINKIEHSSKIDFRVINQTPETIKSIQENYMADYTPTYKA